MQRIGNLKGIFDTLSERERNNIIVDMLVIEAIKNSEIEGEFLSRIEVMSSIKRNLGLFTNIETKDKRAEGMSELVVSIRNNFFEPLTKEMLFDWHKMLMKGNNNILVGAWRKFKEPMQVVSGYVGKEIIHFVAPPSNKIEYEMNQFIEWFNKTSIHGCSPLLQPILRAAISHLYFESIHPFEDGNGRIGRAISEKALYQDAGYPLLLSLSYAIEKNKKDYYSALEKAQKSNHIDEWILYFVNTVFEAQKNAEDYINFTLRKIKFFDRYNSLLNQRQKIIILRMFDEGINGFEGGMNVKKYITIAKTSKATATRDLQNLVSIGAFTPIGQARTIRYELVF